MKNIPFSEFACSIGASLFEPTTFHEYRVNKGKHLFLPSQSFFPLRIYLKICLTNLEILITSEIITSLFRHLHLHNRSVVFETIANCLQEQYVQNMQLCPPFPSIVIFYQFCKFHPAGFVNTFPLSLFSVLILS